MVNLEKLKALAQAATQGPWTADRDDTDWSVKVDGCWDYVICDVQSDLPDRVADAKFIAACSPEVILELLVKLDPDCPRHPDEHKLRLCWEWDPGHWIPGGF